MSPPLLRYRGREIRPRDVESIRELIARNPGLSRRRLSAELCRAWNWVQPNGRLRDMVARSLMLELHRAGHIQLPAKRQSPHNNVVIKRAPRPTPPLREEPREGSLEALGALKIAQVRRSPQEALFNALIQQHHYLAYTQPVGEHLKYLFFAQGDPIGAMAWSSAPRHLAPRDRFIGWPPAARRANLHLIAYNTRFLILPWIRVRSLASHLLARIARRISADWQALYAHEILLLETFIDPARFRGVCYRAANWIHLGLSSGRGHNARTSRRDRPRKQLWVRPLWPDFRRRLHPAA